MACLLHKGILVPTAAAARSARVPRPPRRKHTAQRLGNHQCLPCCDTILSVSLWQIEAREAREKQARLVIFSNLPGPARAGRPQVRPGRMAVTRGWDAEQDGRRRDRPRRGNGETIVAGFPLSAAGQATINREPATRAGCLGASLPTVRRRVRRGQGPPNLRIQNGASATKERPSLSRPVTCRVNWP